MGKKHKKRRPEWRKVEGGNVKMLDMNMKISLIHSKCSASLCIIPNSLSIHDISDFIHAKTQIIHFNS